MRLIEVERKEIILTGITLNSTFAIKNPHQILAVMFQFQTRPHCFQIQPLRGMVMQGQSKIIKIRLKPEYRLQAEKIEVRQNIAIVRATYYCQYNKKLLQANRLRGWSTISNQFEQTAIPIKLCFQAEVQKLKQSYRNGSSLKHSRKQNSFQKFRDSSIKKVKNSKLNEDLDFLFRNQEYARLKSNQMANQPKNQRQYLQARPRQLNNLPKSTHQPVSHPQKVFQSKLSQPQALSPIKNRSTLHYIDQPKKPKDNRAFQLIVLAIVAAVFLAIGEGLGNIIKDH